MTVDTREGRLRPPLPSAPDPRVQKAWNTATALLLVFGIVVRCVQFALPRSLWFDEARNALDILKPTWLEMLPPHVLQPSPFGFFVLERGVAAMLGESEWALRAVPFAAGLGALLLGTHLARRVLEGVAVPIAVGLLALSGPAIYFGSELKPYATDLFVFLGIAVLLLRVDAEERTSPATFAGMTLTGVLAPWLSYTSVFLLAVGGPWLLVRCWNRGRRGDAARWVAVGLTWVASFALLYSLVIAHWSDAGWLNQHWQKNFAPWGSGLGETAAWSFDAFLAAFESPLGLAAWPATVAAVFFAIGAVRAVARPNRLLSLFLGTFALVFASGLLGVYPFHGRLLLFLVPVLAFLAAHGVEGSLRRTFPAVAQVGLAFGLAVFLLAHPAQMAGSVLAGHPLHGSGRTNVTGYEGLRWVIPYLKPRWKPGDVIYLYHGAEPEYRYYARQLGFRPPFVVGTRSIPDRQRYTDELRALQGEPRVWIVFAHAMPTEHAFYLEQLDALGERIDAVVRPRANAYLYDLSAAPPRKD